MMRERCRGIAGHVAIVVAVATGLGALFAGCSTSQIEGHLFISPIQSANGTIDGLALDFVSSQSDLSKEDVMLTITSTVPLLFEAVQGEPNCVQVPEDGRVDVLAASGQLGPDARVIVSAHRDSCGGEPLDNAIWPATSAGPVANDAGSASGNDGATTGTIVQDGAASDTAAPDSNASVVAVDSSTGDAGPSSDAGDE